MGIRENFKTLYNDADEYVKRSIDGYKLMLVESLSLLYGDVACGFVLFMLLFLAFVFMLVAMVVFLAPLTGLLLALLAAMALLVAAAVLVYLFRVRLFVDAAVRRLCRILFKKENGEE
jgi:hypothetical protein